MMTEMENFIQLKKSNVLKIGIKDANGVDTGEWLEFDMDDIELPLRLNKCSVEHRKNVDYAKMQFVIIDKKEDKKGKYLLSWKEEEKIKVLNEFFEKEMKVMDTFLGEGGCKKMLNGRKPYYEMFDDIYESLKPIFPLLEKNVKGINDKVREKYKTLENEGNILE